MKVSVNYILSANKQKKYIQLTKFYGYKYVNGVIKQDNIDQLCFELMMSLQDKNGKPYYD